MKAPGGWFTRVGWRVVRLPPPGKYLGGARNAGWRAARGDWVLFMDDDNAARRREVSTLLRVALRTGAEVVTCANNFFAGEDPPPDDEEDDDEEEEEEDETYGGGVGMDVAGGGAKNNNSHASSGQYAPLGAAAAVGIFRNAFGDANALVSRRALERLGGWPEDDCYGVQDWELFAAAALSGDITVVGLSTS
jgi:glycosyltransferase involved in cell wall biosynthesis